MATNQVQIRRDTASNIASATPAEGELLYDKTNKRLGVGDGSTAGGIAVPNAADTQKQAFTYSTVGGSANAITLTNSPAISSYANGLRLSFKASASNTSATTVNVNGLGAKNIYKLSGTSLVALTGGEIVSGAIYDITYDGTQFQLSNSAGGGSLNYQAFTSSGTWTKPSGFPSTARALLEAWSGGGGGSSILGSNGGGQGGHYIAIEVPLSALGSTETITIAAGGTSPQAWGNNGNDGGTTSIGTKLTITGGKGGTSSAGGNGEPVITTSLAKGTASNCVFEKGGVGGFASAPGGSTRIAGGGGKGNAGSIGASVFAGDGAPDGNTASVNGQAPSGGGGGGVTSVTYGNNGARGEVRITIFR